MADNRNNNRFARTRTGEPRLGRMLVISLGLHLTTLLLIYFGPFQGHGRREILPVYHVDLVNLPVANPQAGRPDARTQPPKPVPPPPKVEETPPPPPPAPPKAEEVRLPEPVKPAPPKPEPPPVAKVEPKPTAPAKPKTVKPTPPKPEPAPRVSAKDEAAAQAKMDEWRRKQDIETLKKDLARLSERDPRATAPIAEAPLGLPTGRGTEAGVDEKTWLQAFFKENWRLSEYQVTRRDLQAVAMVIYSPDGELLEYTLTPSGDPAFDDSVKRAILKEKKLPFVPGRRLILTDVIFNLKDLMDKP